MRTVSCLPALWLLALAAVVAAGCDLTNPADSPQFAPARLPVGALEIGAWLPAGLGGDVRLDGDRLAGLGLTHIEWLQRAEKEGRSAESLAMALCAQWGLRMPVYYEPPGFTPYDKLRNWANRRDTGLGFDDSVRVRVTALVGHWVGQAGLAGYLIGHEDYSRHYRDALARTVRALAQADPHHPAYTVGRFDSYSRRDRFLSAFFQEGGPANVFQHEHYVLEAEVPRSGPVLERRLDDLATGYGRVARALQGRNGRWQAIVQAHGETRDGAAYYRKPTAAEVRVQAGLALARGASGVVYFLYSSGEERLLNGAGELVQVRWYDGLVDASGMPTPLYGEVVALNRQLRALSPVLAPLHFRGGYRGEQLPRTSPLSLASGQVDVGLFGDAERTTHALVVNRVTDAAQAAILKAPGIALSDGVTGAALGDEEIRLELAPGDFRLVALQSREVRHNP